MTDEACIHVSRDDGICTITFDRVAKKNALNMAMYAELNTALDEAVSDDKVRVILVRGAGGDFTSGNDLEDFARFDPAGTEESVVRFLYRLADLNKPLVAAVEGVAVGIGTTLLLHCDLVYAADNAMFQLPFVKLGLCPEAASSLLLPLLAGYQRAAELLLLGEPFSAQKAREIGLVNGVFAAGDVFNEAFGQARKLTALSPAAISASKGLLQRSRRSLVTETITAELAVFRQRLASPETSAALSDFFQRTLKKKQG
ncbi:MAG TPA: enoyl-CoA hydratase [Desulfuromonadales bacterium]|nr:enoyl-CoA hydratase [Desulfuromonadales bacterium]